MTRHLILLIVCIISILNVAAKTDVAKVTFLKGTATVLNAGQQAAFPLNANQTLQEDSSVLTYDKSVMKIQFFDGSQTTLGPNSKLIIKKSDPKQGSILGLLKGTIRSQLNKEDQKKLFIQTRTAALGVRGTDFQTIYNPEIRITSLVTFSGKVAMAKVKPNTITPATASSETLINNVDQFGFDWVSNVTSKSKIGDDFAEFDNLLESSDAVEINPGRFSTTATELKKPTVPVRISPAQFKVMKENTELAAGDQNKIQNIESETKEAIKTENLKFEKIDPPAEGYTNIAKNEFAPKAGGFVDVTSGLYIPPEANAKFDPKAKIFIPSEKVGGVSEQTGEYVAPEGLKLDAKKGFVEVAQVNEQTLKTKEELNKNLEQIVQTKPEEVRKPSFWLNGPLNPDNKLKVGHHHIQFGLIPGNTAYRYTNPYNYDSETYYTKPKGDIRLEYTWRFHRKVAAGLSLNEGDRNFKLPKQVCTGPDCKDDNSKYHWGKRFVFGAFFITPKVYIRAGLGETETPYATINTSSQNYNFTNIMNTMVTTSFNFVFFAREKLKMMNEINFSYFFKNSEHNQSGRGHEIGDTLELVYELNTWFGIYTHLEYNYRYLKITNNYSDPYNSWSDNKTSTMHVHNYGLGLGVLFSI